MMVFRKDYKRKAISP